MKKIFVETCLSHALLVLLVDQRVHQTSKQTNKQVDMSNIAGRCDNKDCQYQHIDPLDKMPLCSDYETGFCFKGEYLFENIKRIMGCYRGVLKSIHR